MNFLAKLLLCMLLLFPIASWAGAEYVGVVGVYQTKSMVQIVRRNGEEWLLTYGVGCLSLWKYDGKTIVIEYPGLFGGVGGSIILPEDNQTCRIWNSEQLK